MSYDALRTEFLRLLTTDSKTKDARRKEFNQAIFSTEGYAIWTQTDLDDVLSKFDKAVRNLAREAKESGGCTVCGAPHERHTCA